MSVNARTICTDALTDLGVIGQGETPSAADMQTCFTRLNTLVNTLQTQSLTVTSVQRVILPVVANKQTYTIGPDGDYDLPRPVRIQGAGLLLSGLASARTVTSVTSSGFVATVTLSSHGLSVGGEVFITGAEETVYNGLQTVETVPSSSTFTYALDGDVVTPATGTITAAILSASAVEIPRAVYTDDAYEAIQIKRLTNTQFTGVYYNPSASPFGTIVLWPVPTTASNQLVLYLSEVFAAFADLDTDYSWPETPGYQEMLQYALAQRLIGPFAIGNQIVVQFVQQMAARALGLVKRQNYMLTDLPIDPALTRSYAGGYNINTGTGGGSTA